MDSPATGVRGSSGMPRVCRASPASAYIRRESIRPARIGTRPRKMFSPTVRLGTIRISWWIRTTPWSSASDGDFGAYTSPSTVIVPPVGWTMPAMIELRVDLPAPFSPMSPTTRPAVTDRSTPLRTSTPL